MAEKIVIQLEVDAKNGVATVGSLQKATTSAAKSTKDLEGGLFDVNKKLDELSGGAVSGFKNVVNGVQSGVKSMGKLKLAIAATGLGLLAIAAAALVEYFTNFEKPLKLVDTVMNAIGGAVNALVDSFDKLLSGDVLGFFSDVADGASNAVDATNRLYAAQEQIFELQKKTIVQNAELKATVEANLKDAADTSLALEDRLDAQERVNVATEQLIANERLLAAAELERLTAEKEIENNYETRRELEIQIEQTTANLINIEAALNRQRQDASKSEREIIAQDQALKDTAAKTEVERIAALVAARKEALAQIDTALRTANEQEVFEIRTKYAELISLARQYGQDTVELERQRKEELNALDPQSIDPIAEAMARIEGELGAEQAGQFAKLELRQKTNAAITADEDKNAKIQTDINKAEAMARLAVFGGLANSLAGLLGEQTSAGKAAAVAAATISTAQGVAASIGAYGATPIGFIAAGTALATGIAQVKTILSTKVPGGKSSGGGGAAPQAPRVGNAIGLINPNQQGEITGQSLAQGLNEQPIRAFVVSENVTNQQNLDDQIQANGQFG